MNKPSSVLAVLGVAAIFASCAGDGTAPSEIALEDVGRFHNEGLAHVFVRLTNAEREGSGLSTEQLNQVVNDGLREFLTTAGFEGISLQSIAAQATSWREFNLSGPDYSVEAVQTVGNYGLAAPALSEATCAANGVDFREPRNPQPPAVAHVNVLPWRSVIVMIVLLKDA